MSGEADGWFRSFVPAAPGAPRLICFPHAGGAAPFFLPLARQLAPDIEVLAVQYPGRHDRRGEPVVEDLGVLAGRVCDALAAVPGSAPTAFFGHSMGSVVAFEAALRCEGRLRLPRPDALIVSGGRAPALPRLDVVLDGDRALLTEVVALGGTSSAVLADEDLRALVLPAIRGDYRALRAYRHVGTTRLACPITALVGAEDPRVTPAQADRWRENTTGRFELKVFPGGHFYLLDGVREVASAVRVALSALV